MQNETVTPAVAESSEELTESQSESRDRARALKARIEADNERRKAERKLPIPFTYITLLRGGFTIGAATFDRQVLHSVPGKMSLRAIKKIERAYDAICEAEQENASLILS